MVGLSTPGASRRGAVVAAALTPALYVLAFSGPARASSAVFWSNALGSGISLANLDGSGGGRVDVHGVPPIAPEGVTIDPSTGRIYWADRAANAIEWADLETGAAGVLNTKGATVDEPMGIVVGSGRRSIYWANHGANSISWARLNGSGGADLPIPRAESEEPIGVTVGEGLLWSAGGEHPGIYSAHIAEEPGDPSSPVEQLQTGSATVSRPAGLAVVEGRVYWANSAQNASHQYTISYAKLNSEVSGGDLETSGTPVDRPLGVAVDPRADRIYWVNAGSPGIAFASLDGKGEAGRLALGSAPVDEPAFAVLSEIPQMAPLQSLFGPEAGRPELRWFPATVPPWAGSRFICDTTEFGWERDLPGAFLVRAPTQSIVTWQLNGVTMGTASLFPAFPAASVGTYTCTATVSNIAGAVSIMSRAVTVVPAPPLVLEHLAETYPRFAVGAGSTPPTGSASRRRRPSANRHARAPVGTTFSFTLSRWALAKIVIERAGEGRRAHGKCEPLSRRSRARAQGARSTAPSPC